MLNIQAAPPDEREQMNDSMPHMTFCGCRQYFPTHTSGYLEIWNREDQIAARQRHEMEKKDAEQQRKIMCYEDQLKMEKQRKMAEAMAKPALNETKPQPVLGAYIPTVEEKQEWKEQDQKRDRKKALELAIASSTGIDGKLISGKVVMKNEVEIIKIAQRFYTYITKET